MAGSHVVPRLGRLAHRDATLDYEGESPVAVIAAKLATGCCDVDAAFARAPAGCVGRST